MTDSRIQALALALAIAAHAGTTQAQTGDGVLTPTLDRSTTLELAPEREGTPVLTTQELVPVVPPELRVDALDIELFLEDFESGYLASELRELRAAVQAAHPGLHGKGWGCANYTKLADGPVPNHPMIGATASIGDPAWPPCPLNVVLSDGSRWARPANGGCFSC